MSWQQRYLERFYLNRNGWVDGTTEFHRLCAGIIKKGTKILEIGAGPTNRTSDFLATLGELHAVDIDAEVKNNRAAVTAHVIKGERYPFADETFDACVSNYVVEHIAMPTTHLREVWRVLKSGGAYLFRTPNLFIM
jgi:ubiquinone/menaquinone biosynthesis C-methylase UbiE